MSDLISRQDLITSFRLDDDGKAWSMDDIIYRIEQFPSTEEMQQKAQQASDTISRQAAIDAVEKTKTVRSENNELYVAKINAEMNIMQLPTVEPQKSKIGHWKQISPAGIYECDLCGKNVMTKDIDAYKFCHGCGSPMEVTNDGSVTDNIRNSVLGDDFMGD